MISLVLITAMSLMGAVAHAAGEVNSDTEVIEGQRKESPIFVQLDPSALDRDLLMLKRADFNDFHNDEKTFRLKLQARESRK